MFLYKITGYTMLFFSGLPNNQLPVVPTEAIAHLPKLERLDLSNNKIYNLDANSFKVSSLFINYLLILTK